jgi:hypothetical protein
MPQWFCLDCHSQEQRRKRLRVPGIVELAAWVLAIGAGLLAGAWWPALLALAVTFARASSGVWECPACGSRRMVPQQSPAAQKAAGAGGSAGR